MSAALGERGPDDDRATPAIAFSGIFVVTAPVALQVIWLVVVAVAVLRPGRATARVVEGTR